MTKKLWYYLLVFLLLLVIVLSININRLQAQVEVREEAIDNLVKEASIEQIRAFRSAVKQVQDGRKVIDETCKKGRTYIPADLFNFYCG